jgi:hypothetical protein
METIKDLNISYKSLCLTILKPIELYHVKARAHIMVRIGRNENNELYLDIDDTDYQDIEFISKAYLNDYETYKKFTVSFKELTEIDIIKEFDDYIEASFPKTVLLEYLIEHNLLNI